MRYHFVAWIVVWMLNTTRIVSGQQIYIQGAVQQALGNARLGSHVTYGAGLHVSYLRNMNILVGWEYFSKRYFWSTYQLRYLDATYMARNAQLVRDNAIVLSLRYRLHTRFFIGTQVGVDLIKFKRITYDETIPYVIYFDHAEAHVGEAKDLWMLRPRFAWQAGTRFLLVRRFSLELDLTFKSLLNADFLEPQSGSTQYFWGVGCRLGFTL